MCENIIVKLPTMESTKTIEFLTFSESIVVNFLYVHDGLGFKNIADMQGG